MWQWVLLLLVHASFLGARAVSGVVELDLASFDSVVNSSDCCAALVQFYAPWCGGALARFARALRGLFPRSHGASSARRDSYSDALAPEFALAAASFDSARDRVSFARVDATAQTALSNAHGVTGCKRERERARARARHRLARVRTVHAR